MSLNDEQCVAILTEGLQRKVYENNGKVPDDPEVRLRDAEALVNVAQNAFNNGNRSDNVNTILFIAQVDAKPLVEQKPNIAPVKQIVTSSIHNGLDLSTLADGVLDALLEGLANYPQNEKVEEDRVAYLAEKERRANGQNQPAAATQAQGNQAPGEIAAEGAQATPAVADQTATAAGTGDASTAQEGDSGATAADPAQGENASAFAGAQTPETTGQGKSSKAKQTPEDPAVKEELENQLTLPIVKAHGIDLTELGKLPIEQIEFMLAHPDGAPKEEKMPVTESEIEASAIPNDEVKSVGGIVGTMAPTQKIVSKAELGLALGEEEEVTGKVSVEREKLESMVTGPMLKAFRRGRREVPDIGDNELRFMILNSDGRVTQDELEKAKQLDSGMDDNNEPLLITAKEIIDTPVEQPSAEIAPVVSSPVKEEDRTIAQAAQEVAAKVPPAPDPVQQVEAKNEATTSAQMRAMEIIKSENMPIPPDIDGEVPPFPNDISKVSDGELFSYHAIYHACESRTNWILLQYEEELSDISKLRSFTEAKVASNVPLLADDGKRITNEQRDAIVGSNSEVVGYINEEQEVNKLAKRLKVLRDNYRSDTAVCSRQWSMRSGELKDAPK